MDVGVAEGILSKVGELEARVRDIDFAGGFSFGDGAADGGGETGLIREEDASGVVSEEMKAVDREKERLRRREAAARAFDRAFAGASKTLADTQRAISGLYSAVVRMGDVLIAAMELLDEIMKYPESYSDAVREYCVLMVRKIVLLIRRKLVELNGRIDSLKVSVLSKVAFGRVCGEISAAFGAVISAVKTAADSVRTAIDALHKIIDMIPPNFQIGACGMSFFPTPKYIMGGVGMAISNQLRSLVEYVAGSIETAVNGILTSAPVQMAVSKASIVASAAASAVSTLSVPVDVDLSSLPPIPSSLDLARLLDAVLSYLPVAQPLPKYERLNILTNPGFLIFLATGFCRAGGVAFGLPGQMPGSPAAYPETCEA